MSNGSTINPPPNYRDESNKPRVAGTVNQSKMDTTSWGSPVLMTPEGNFYGQRFPNPTTFKEVKIPESIMSAIYISFRDDIQESLDELEESAGYKVSMKGLDERYLRGDNPGGVVHYMTPTETDELGYGTGGRYNRVKVPYTIAEATSGEEFMEFTAPDTIRLTEQAFFNRNYFGHMANPDLPGVIEDEEQEWYDPHGGTKTLAHIVLHEFLHGTSGTIDDWTKPKTKQESLTGNILYPILNKESNMAIPPRYGHDRAELTQDVFRGIVDNVLEGYPTDNWEYDDDRHRAIQKLQEWYQGVHFDE